MHWSSIRWLIWSIAWTAGFKQDSYDLVYMHDEFALAKNRFGRLGISLHMNISMNLLGSIPIKNSTWLLGGGGGGGASSVTTATFLAPPSLHMHTCAHTQMYTHTYTDVHTYTCTFLSSCLFIGHSAFLQLHLCILLNAPLFTPTDLSTLS